ncbi:membrane bound O-acyl transferase [Baffinella frigidus]|nr:membrane bound O-acyl transferase [Cryptophyta sp. CCMP2293]
MLDGIEVPDNMKRCVVNNCTFAGFWRQWHASLNLWIVRYIYIPLGGRASQAWSVWVIFTFVGLWHDLLWRWLAWAWLNCIFFSLETAVVKWASGPALATLHEKHSWEYLVALAGALNMLLLILANLAIMHGFQGSVDFLRRIFFAPGQVS